MRLTVMLALVGCPAPSSQLPAPSLALSGTYDPASDVIADADHWAGSPMQIIGTTEDVLLGPASGLIDPPPSLFITPSAAAHIATLAPGDPTVHGYAARVVVHHNHPRISADLASAIAAGTLNDDADYQVVHANWLSGRAAALAPDIASAAAAVVSSGGTVTYSGTYTPNIVFEADEPSLSAIMASGALEVLSLETGPEQVDHGSGIDGLELQSSIGLTEFGTTGEDIDGDGVNEIFEGEGQRLAIWETGQVRYPDHPGYFADPPSLGGSPFARNSRIVGEVNCDVNGLLMTCGPSIPAAQTWDDRKDGDWDGRTQHAAQTVAIAIGDVTRLQDPFLGSPTAREQRSFAARRSTIDVYSSGQPTQRDETWARRGIVEEIIAGSPSTHHILIVTNGLSEEFQCDGRGESRILEDVLDAGTLSFAAAGNQALSTGGPCSVLAPADSLGALAVGNFHDGVKQATSSCGISSFSLTDDNRVLGLGAPGRYDHGYFKDAAYPPVMAGYTDDTMHLRRDVEGFKVQGLPPDYGSEFCDGVDNDADGFVDENLKDSDFDGTLDCMDPAVMTGTSYAAPAAAGSMAVFREYYTEKYSRFADDPGILMVQALIHGSGFDAPVAVLPGAVVDDFSSCSGAGGLRVRLNDSADLTGPWAWVTGHMCLHDKQRRDFSITDFLPGSTMPGGVAEMRAVAWWPDTATRRDAIRMQLVRNGVVIGTADRDVNRQRLVMAAPSAGASFDLRLEGVDIRGSEDGCGAQGQRVYFAVMFTGEAGF